MYDNGRGVTRNRSVSNEWYLKAANNGNTQAQYSIGINYLDSSNGLPCNRTQALKWRKKAADNGHAQAKLKWEP